MKFSGILLLVILSAANALPSPGYPIAAMSVRSESLLKRVASYPIAERLEPDPDDPDNPDSYPIAERLEPDPDDPDSYPIARRSDCRYPDTRSYPIAERGC
ncbi:5626_t:CDS:1 [Paraglomus brasilianum]|uniref:5626_t:CDS:1 n=1 Tax=Paraglomus brasilianum TaxID=144538 RepID=A0A9N8W5I6_9GLOM|nr:5626_t:CDS:1 [Paraglomus brasilianum]